MTYYTELIDKEVIINNHKTKIIDVRRFYDTYLVDTSDGFVCSIDTIFFYNPELKEQFYKK